MPHKGGFYKTRFDDLYDLPDCRAYYRALEPLEYQIPSHVVPVARWALAELRRLRGVDTPWVVDVASGYGIASALLRHEVNLGAIFECYCGKEWAHADANYVTAKDREWYAARRRPGAQPRVAGIDISRNALDYGKKVGLYDECFTDDLEADDPGPELSALLSEVCLVIEMGGIGYIGANSFRRLLDAIGEPRPWVIIAPTRVSDHAPSLELFENAGMVVERAPCSPFRHRRFTGDEEMMHALSELQRKGMATSGLEDTGFYFADAYVARPPRERLVPISSLHGQ